MIDFAKKAIEERSKKKVNVVFIATGNGNPDEKVFCNTCRQYMRYIEGDIWLCARCGKHQTNEEREADKLENTFKSSPMIAKSRRGKHERRPADFPAGPEIKNDIEYRSDGTQRKIEYDS